MVLEVVPGEILVPDLGSDAVWQYTVAQDAALTEVGATTLPPGSGPRHAALGQGGKVYVVAELSLQVMELGSDCAEGAEGAARGVCRTADIPSTSTAAAGAGNSTFTSAAAIRVSRDQRFLYVSLRTEEDSDEEGSIAGFALGADGSLGELVGTWGSGGQQPRDFALVEVPGIGEVVVVANRRSSEVVVLDRDGATGALGELLAAAAVGSPASVLALEGAADMTSPFA